MFFPNPAPSTAGSGYTRARTPQGGMSPTALSALFPSATATEQGLTAAEAGSQTYPVALLLTGHLRDACDNFSHIVHALAECRRQHGHCGAFLCTWTTTERLTPSHGAARHIPVDALPCVARLHRALQPISMQVHSGRHFTMVRAARGCGDLRACLCRVSATTSWPWPRVPGPPHSGPTARCCERAHALRAPLCTQGVRVAQCAPEAWSYHDGGGACL